MKPNKGILAMLFSCLFLPLIQAQETIPISGGDATGIGGSSSYSVGQIVYTANSSASGSTYQGVQLPFEIFDEGSLAVGGTPDIQLGIKVYPNPTLYKLTLSINGNNIDSVQYQLYDLNGRLLLTNKVRDQETTIPMDDYPSATYSLVVLKNNKPIKSFKFIKK